MTDGAASPSAAVDFRTAIPASFGQRRLWFVCRADDATHLAYQMLGGVRIHGRLDVDGLERAIDAVVARHEVLRTTFRYRSDDLYQVIHPHAPFALDRLDHRNEPAESLSAFLEAAARQPFDLAAGPLVRATVVTTGDDQHALILAIHHTICDGWSLAVLLREIASAYRDVVAGRPVALPPLPIQYADYAVWQRNRLSGGELDGQFEYWRKQLADLTPLPLPGATPSATGGHAQLSLDPDLVTRLTALVRGEGATLHAGLVAGVTALLSAMTGATDVPVGTAVAGRQHVDLEDLVGFFVNTLVIRTDHTGTPTFRQLLRRVQQTCLDAYANQDVPFEKLVEELRPRRSGADSPLFQVMVTLQNQPTAPLTLPGARVEKLPYPVAFTPLPLDLVFREEPDGGLRGDLSYQTAMFDDSALAKLSAQFAGLLTAAVAEPDRPLADLTAAVTRWSAAVPPSTVDDDEAPPYVAPRTPLESAIADQWRELLCVTDPIGVHDSFFDIGGHSLLAVRAMAALSAHLGTELPINLILEHPTIAGLAARVPDVAAAPTSEIRRLPRVLG